MWGSKSSTDHFWKVCPDVSLPSDKGVYRVKVYSPPSLTQTLNFEPKLWHWLCLRPRIPNSITMSNYNYGFRTRRHIHLGQLLNSWVPLGRWSVFSVTLLLHWLYFSTWNVVGRFQEEDASMCKSGAPNSVSAYTKYSLYTIFLLSFLSPPCCSHFLILRKT